MDNLDRIRCSLPGKRDGFDVLVGANASSFGILVCDDSVATVQMGGQPMPLHDSLKCDQGSTDNGQDDKEDARACICRGRQGRPGGGEERSVVGVGEAHAH